MTAPQGIIETVYSWVYPETKVVFDQVRTAADVPAMYERAWTKQQDPMHTALIEGWTRWAQPRLEGSWDAFPQRYVAAGSSEAIRESIAYHATRAFRRGEAPAIHVFEGEYEGYTAYAQAHACTVHRHARASAIETLREKASRGQRVYLSAPSSIDGMVWDELPGFLDAVASLDRDIRVSLDLCYVGCVGQRDYRIGFDHPVVDEVFFSLSKVFGVYYHRVGGMFSRHELPGLFGNKWFKNLLSIRLGCALMNAHAVDELPRRYAWAQRQATDELKALQPHARPSDVVLLAHAMEGRAGEPFCRVAGQSRYCLSPRLDQLVAERGGA